MRLAFKFSDIPMFIWMLLIAIWAAFSFTSCSPTPVKSDENVFYRRDIELEVNGYKGSGVLVVPRAAKYAMEINAKGKLDLFTFQTCHREDVREDAGKSGLFGDKRKIDLNYIPVAGLEDTGACPVALGGYEQQGGRHSWAMIDFEDPAATLPAVLKCNGQTIQSRGVSICQSKEGLTQQIEFPVPVIVNPAPGCSMPRKDKEQKKIYTFNISPRECVFNFMEAAAPNREHRLTTLGYSQVLIRGK